MTEQAPKRMEEQAGSFPILPRERVAPISSLLIKPTSALCNLDCTYCFYLDRATDPYKALSTRTMTAETLAAMIRNYLSYCGDQAVFAWQGGEPTLAGHKFFEKACRLQMQYGADGQVVSNSVQTNATLLDERWCEIFKQYSFLLGVSLDGPEDVHNSYRLNKGGQGTWRRVIESVELLTKEGVDFNILCVVSRANVRRAKELYRFFRDLGVDFIQYIPLAEFNLEGTKQPWAVTPKEYGRFLAETFRLWWPNRKRVRIRYFDNIAEALAGLEPGNCAMHDRCDSYAVVEWNGDVYPCDFFVREEWKLGNVRTDSFEEIAQRRSRFEFSKKKALKRPECLECKYERLCRGGCPKMREGPQGQFEDLDYFCESYKTIFRVAVPKLRVEVEKLTGRPALRI